MKHFLLSLLTIVLALNFSLGVSYVVRAQTTDPLLRLNDAVGKSGLKEVGSGFHELSSVEPGADQLTSLVFKAIDFLKYFLGSIAVLFVIVSGVKMVAAGKKIDEVSEKEKESLKLIIYGLILIITADALVTKVFFGDYGECVASASNAQDCAKAGSSIIKGMYSLALSLVASVSILIITIAGFRMVTAYGEEETITKEKKRITMAIVGLLVAGVGEFVVKGIVFPEGGSKPIDVAQASKLVYTFTNFVAAFIATGAFIMFFYAGYLYVTSAGNEEETGKAKKIMISAVIGIVIAFAAYGIVTTLRSFPQSRVGSDIPLPRSVPEAARSLQN